VISDHLTGDYAKWRTYGWSFNRSTGNGLYTYGTHRLEAIKPDVVFGSLVHALGRANVQPQSVDVILRGGHQLTPSAFTLMPDAARPTIMNLKKLMLALSPGPLAPDAHHFPHASYDEAKDLSLVPLKRFLHLLPALETLRLNFSERIGLGAIFLAWLSSPIDVNQQSFSGVLTNGLVAPAALPSLTRLDLGMLNVSANVLAKVLTKFELTSLNLWKVTLRCGDPAMARKEPSCWSNFFESLSSNIEWSTRLKFVHTGILSQTYFDSNRPGSPAAFEPVYFAKDGNRDNRKHDNQTTIVTYKAQYGSKAASWFKEIAKSVCLSVTESDKDDSSDEDNDDEHSDDDEDEAIDDNDDDENEDD
jgi:hypothetical protein